MKINRATLKTRSSRTAGNPKGQYVDQQVDAVLGRRLDGPRPFDARSVRALGGRDAQGRVPPHGLVIAEGTGLGSYSTRESSVRFGVDVLRT